MRFVAHNLGISVIPSIFARIYSEGERINYYQMEPEVRLFHEWAVIYNDQLETSLVRRENYFIFSATKGLYFMKSLMKTTKAGKGNNFSFSCLCCFLSCL